MAPMKVTACQRAYLDAIRRYGSAGEAVVGPMRSRA
jgi:hypothetical protein